MNSGSESKKIADRIGHTLFLAIFVIVGLVFFLLLIKLFFQEYERWSWQPTPSRILSLAPVMKDGQKTAQWKLQYAYEFAGRKYIGDRWSDLYPQDEMPVRQLQKLAQTGDSIPCFVNPAAPERAILIRKFSWTTFLILVVPLVFILVPGFLIYRDWFGPDPERAPESVRQRNPAKTTAEYHDYTLADSMQPVNSPWRKFGIILFFTILFDIFAGSIVMIMPLTSTAGIIVRMVSVSCGILLAGICLYLFCRGWSNARFRVRLDHSRVYPGLKFAVIWEKRNSVRPSHLEIRWEGREEVYHLDHADNGPNVPEVNVFHDETVLTTDDPDAIAAGHADITVSPDTMYSFKIRHYAIICTLTISSQNNRRRQVEYEYVVHVVPQPVQIAEGH